MTGRLALLTVRLTLLLDAFDLIVRADFGTGELGNAHDSCARAVRLTRINLTATTEREGKSMPLDIGRLDLSATPTPAPLSPPPGDDDARQEEKDTPTASPPLPREDTQGGIGALPTSGKESE